MRHYASMSAEYITSTFNTLADKLNKLMKSGRFDKVVNTFLI